MYAKHSAIEIIGTKRVIGIQLLRDYGKRMAAILGYPEPDKYTSHWMRRSSISLAADSGLSSKQIMALSGHKSEKTINLYMAKSDHMRRVHAKALALNQEENTSSTRSVGHKSAAGDNSIHGIAKKSTPNHSTSDNSDDKGKPSTVSINITFRNGAVVTDDA